MKSLKEIYFYTLCMCSSKMSKFTYTSSAVPKNNLRLRIKKLSQSRVDQMQQYMFYAQYMYGEYIKIRHIYCT